MKLKKISALALSASLLLTACGESAAEKAQREQIKKEATQLAAMPPTCDSEKTMNVVKKLIRKYVDPFNIGKNKQYSGIAEVERKLDILEYRCRARLTYNYVGTQKSHYLEYSIYWANDNHNQFQVEMTTITNND
ncbi:hypothetical protein RHO13_09470 [Orbus wheelerorum]|uniref:hypothetical protein n=1 Tax=Orbus wheelerorum TaxID=3074111 RepID=UPI00370DA540